LGCLAEDDSVIIEDEIKGNGPFTTKAKVLYPIEYLPPHRRLDICKQLHGECDRKGYSILSRVIVAPGSYRLVAYAVVEHTRRLFNISPVRNNEIIEYLSISPHLIDGVFENIMKTISLNSRDRGEYFKFGQDVIFKEEVRKIYGAVQPNIQGINPQINPVLMNSNLIR